MPSGGAIWFGRPTSAIWRRADSGGLLAAASWHVMSTGYPVVLVPASYRDPRSAVTTCAQRYRSLAAGSFGQGASMGVIQLPGHDQPRFRALLAGLCLSPPLPSRSS